MRNIELKARIADLAAARSVAQRLATEYVGVLRQVDTYFHCHHGRLKLRETDGGLAQLVGYARPDQPEAKGSDYQLVAVSDPAALKQTLTAALGVWRVVEKRREVYLVDNVRIHLDEVVDLGTFVEFEAVLGTDIDDAHGQAQVADLMREFGVEVDDLISGSYSDLIGNP